MSPVVFFILLTLCQTLAPASWAQGEKSRAIEFKEKLTFTPPLAARRLKIWIPMPANDAYQQSELIRVEAPWKHQVTQDPDFGNSLVFIETTRIPKEAAQVQVVYRVKRVEQKGFNRNVREPLNPIHAKPRGLVVVNSAIKKMARDAVADLKDPLERARALYHYVLSRMDYDTTGTGWGFRDTLYACEARKGNCTDFHSLFMSLA